MFLGGGGGGLRASQAESCTCRPHAAKQRSCLSSRGRRATSALGPRCLPCAGPDSARGPARPDPGHVVFDILCVIRVFREESQSTDGRERRSKFQEFFYCLTSRTHKPRRRRPQGDDGHVSQPSALWSSSSKHLACFLLKTRGRHLPHKCNPRVNK